MRPVTSLDTTASALCVQRRILSGMSRRRRLEIAVQMSDDARDICVAGIRALHPAWTEGQVRRALLVRIYGAELVERAWGPDLKA